MDANVDLFDNIEALPIEIQDILEKYSDGENDYETCKQLHSELLELGYTFEYYLDAQPYNLRKL